MPNPVSEPRLISLGFLAVTLPFPRFKFPSRDYKYVTLDLVKAGQGISLLTNATIQLRHGLENTFHLLHFLGEIPVAVEEGFNLLL